MRARFACVLNCVLRIFYYVLVQSLKINIYINSGGKGEIMWHMVQLELANVVFLFDSSIQLSRKIFQN